MLTLIKKHKILSTIVVTLIMLWIVLYGIPIIKKHFDNYLMRPDMQALRNNVSSLGSTEFTDTCGFVEDTYSRRTTICTMRVYTHIQGEDDTSIARALTKYSDALEDTKDYTPLDSGYNKKLNLKTNIVVASYKHKSTNRKCNLQHHSSKGLAESHGQPGTTISFACRY